MEDCKICYSTVSDKKLPCGHDLCSSCVVRLNSALCPFCRKNFLFTAEEIKQRIKLKIVNGYQVEVPPGLAFNPLDWVENRQLNVSLVNREQNMVSEPFSRARKSMERRRRRFLSFEEVLERRQIIKDRKARHWDKKNAQLQRTQQGWWEV